MYSNILKFVRRLFNLRGKDGMTYKERVAYQRRWNKISTGEIPKINDIEKNYGFVCRRNSGCSYEEWD